MARRSGSRRQVRATLAGWSRWLPFVLLPFGIFFAETWMRTEQLRMDYETNRINAGMRLLDEQMNELRVQEASLDNMERMQIHAPNLGLVEPTRDQIQVVKIEIPDFVAPDRGPMALAQLPMSFMESAEE